MTICVPWFGCMTILVEMHLLCDYSGNLPSIPTACDPIRAAGCASFQSGRHHRYSLVDSTPTTKEETFIMPPCSSSAGFSGVWAGCSGLSPSCGCIWTCTLGLRWCHVFRSTIVLRLGSWSKSGVFCACSVVGQIAVLRHAGLCLHLWMCVPS